MKWKKTMVLLVCAVVLLSMPSCAMQGAGESSGVSSSLAKGTLSSLAAAKTSTVPSSTPISEGTNSKNESLSLPFPDFKDIEYQSEGSKSKERFVLFNPSSVPFLTYLPQKDWISEQTDSNVTIKNQNSCSINIYFLNVENDSQKAKKIFSKAVKIFSGSEPAKFEQQEKPQWAVSSLYLWEKAENGGGGTMTWAILGTHNRQYFYICTRCSGEAESCYPILKAILQEWRWKDTEEPLGYSL